MKAMRSILLLGLTAVLSACARGVDHPVEDYRRVADYKDKFEVCCLSDIHLSLLSDTDYEFNYLKHVIYSNVLLLNNDEDDANDVKVDGKKIDIATATNEQLKAYAPDVIVLKGDVFQTGDKSVVRRFFSWIDSLDIPFAFLYGNHDLHGLYGEKFVEQEVMKCKNSLLINPHDTVFGDCNYYLDLKSGDDVKWQLIFVDSNTYYGLDYDVVHDNQIDWYQKVVEESNKAPNLTFFHIPFEEFEKAWQYEFKGKAHPENGGDYAGPSDCWMEDTGVAKGYRENEFFEKMEELGATKGVICAHDHTNNTDFYYREKGAEPIRLIYGTKTGHGIYHDTKIMGCDFYYLNADETFTRKRVNVQYENPEDAFVMTSRYINSGGKER